MTLRDRRPRTGVYGALLTSVLVWATTLTAPATAGSADLSFDPTRAVAADQVASPPLADTATTITLVTGDVVQLRHDGGRTGYVVTDPDGAKVRDVHAVTGRDGGMRVIPHAVAPLVGSVLDIGLFDVTAIEAAGLSDDRVAGLPLVVELEAGATPTVPGLGRLVPETGTTVRTVLGRSAADQLGAALASGELPGVRRLALDLAPYAAGAEGSADGAVALTTLTVHVRDRSGKVFGDGDQAWVDWNDIDNPDLFPDSEYIVAGEEGFVEQVEPGRYAMSLQARLANSEGGFDLVEVDIPDVVVDGPTEVMLDASLAHEITVDVGEPADLDTLCVATYRENAAGRDVLEIDSCVEYSLRGTRAFAAPTPLPTDGDYVFSSHWVLDGTRWYDLHFPHHDRVPEDPGELAEAVGPEDVAERLIGYAAGGRTNHFLWRFSYLPHQGSAMAMGYSFTPPMRSVDWLTGGSVRWGEQVTLLQRRTKRIPAGSSHHVTWYGQPLRPSSLGTSTRLDNSITFRLANWRDHGGHWRVRYRYDDQSFVLTADGEAVATRPHGWYRIRVPDGEATFVARLRAHGLEGSPFSNHLDTTWTFDSATTATSEPLPLLEIDYGIGADLRQRAPYPTPIELRVGHEAKEITTDIASCTLVATNDGGETWHPVELTEAGPGVFTGTIQVPGTEPGEMIGLRVAASDADGGSIRQEILGAFLAAE